MKGQVKGVPLHRLLPKRDSHKDITTADAPVCETKQRQLEYVLVMGLYFTKSMTIFQCIYEQWIDIIIDEVNDYQRQRLNHLFNNYIRSIQCVQLNHVSYH